MQRLKNPVDRRSRRKEAVSISDFGFRISDFDLSLLTSAPTIINQAFSVVILSAGLLLTPSQQAWADPAGELTRPTQPPKEEPKRNGNEGINAGLRQSSWLLSRSNMLNSAHFPGESAGPDKWRVLLEMAQQQHVRKDYPAATRNLTAIMAGKTPDEMKRSALIELAVMAQEQNQLPKAQQILAQYLRA